MDFEYKLEKLLTKINNKIKINNYTYRFKNKILLKEKRY
jgi:hypothetical protein